MDVESPLHLERLRDQPEIKAVLLRAGLTPGDTEARFERAPKNTRYWNAIASLSARFLADGRSEEVREPHEVYGRACWLLATTMGRPETGPYAIAMTAADGAPLEDLRMLLLDVSRDYWHGSSFWK